MQVVKVYFNLSISKLKIIFFIKIQIVHRSNMPAILNTYILNFLSEISKKNLRLPILFLVSHETNDFNLSTELNLTARNFDFAIKKYSCVFELN